MDAKELANIVLTSEEKRIISKYKEKLPNFWTPEAIELAKINKKLDINKEQIENLIFESRNEIAELEYDIRIAREEINELEDYLEIEEERLEKLKKMLDEF
jgi:predicted  nucleic acid-binding Zn-ribbon protein